MFGVAKFGIRIDLVGGKVFQQAPYNIAEPQDDQTQNEGYQVESCSFKTG